MKGFKGNIEQLTLDNDTFRKLLYTAENLQLVLMSLNTFSNRRGHREERQSSAKGFSVLCCPLPCVSCD